MYIKNNKVTLNKSKRNNIKRMPINFQNNREKRKIKQIIVPF